MMIDLVHAESGDWVGLYIEGLLAHEGHSIEPSHLLRLLKLEYSTRHDWDGDTYGQLPQRYSEVHAQRIGAPPAENDFRTGTGEVLHNVHAAPQCAGRPCVIHRPSAHGMRDFPTHWRSDRGIMERICPHGVGHPDPDDQAYLRRVQGDKYDGGVHGCDGCCIQTTDAV